MSLIQLLPDSVANQIAAGEVVQRPASVVKELVENAFDAGATQVTVVLKFAGKSLIQVIDNGCGMSETDARMAFERHATSKIRQATDLFNIRTMGFRGEALASIAAVAQVELQTKLHDHEVGVSIAIAGSKIDSQNTIHCASGSQFLVKNLFFNIPARRKFLKKDSTEFKHILDEIQRIAIPHPELALKLVHNDEEIYNLQQGNSLQRIQSIFGKSIGKELVPISSQSPLVKIDGFIGTPESAKKSTGQQFFFVNGRFLKHPYFYKTLLNTYKDLISPDAIPSFFIFLEVDTETIDINIHPTKTEVKFENEQAIAQILGATVRESIGKFNFTSSMNFDEVPIHFATSQQLPNDVALPNIHIDPEYNPFGQQKNSLSGFGTRKLDQTHQNQHADWSAFMAASMSNAPSLPTQERLFDAASGHSVHTSAMMQVNLKYIVTATEKGLMLIHQRRAHHRILFEQYLQNFTQHKAPAQHLVFPISKPISENYALMIQEIKAELELLGFILEIDNQQLNIQAMPEHLKESQAMDSLDSMVEDFAQFNVNLEYERQKYVAKKLSYNASVGYRSLEVREMQQIVADLFLCSEPAYCPRGKRIFTLINFSEIEYKLQL